MAKGIYVGVEEPVMKPVQGDIIPKSWTKVSDLEYVSDNGIKLTASSIYSKSNPLSNVCDGQVGYGDSYYFFTNSTVADQWVQIEFPTAQKITKINLAIKLSGNSAIKIRGSKNGSDWVELYSLEGTASTFPQTLEEYALNNSDYYKFYRVVAISIAYNASMNLIVYEWQTAEYEAPSSETKGIARKVKKAYVGVDGVARKIKKGYIGVDGIARLFYSGDPELSYYGTVTSLSAARSSLAATTVGDYAIFAGGYGDSGVVATVDTYNSSLTKGTATALSVARQCLAATRVGTYALFGGGMASSRSAVVDTYSKTLAKGTATTLQSARQYLAATRVGTYALFGGGMTSSYSAQVDCYTNTLSKTTATALSAAQSNLAATTVGDYALFGGGNAGTNTAAYYATVDTYNSSLVKGTATNLSKARSYLAATTVGDYALFGGGRTGGGYYGLVYYATVDTYNSSLVKGTATDLSVAREQLVATNVGGYAIFAGGYGDSARYAQVDRYNASLVKGTVTNLSEARTSLAATSVGGYALCGGGAGTSRSAIVDVYQVL